MEEVIKNQFHSSQDVEIDRKMNTKHRNGHDVFATVTLKSTEDEVFALSKECERESIVHTAWVANILGRTSFPEKNNLSEVDLVKFSPRDLGICRYVTRREIYDVAASVGLNLCPQETAIRFVNQVDRFFSEELVVATRPLYDTSGSAALLTIQRQKNRKIIAAKYGEAHLIWKPDSQWLFATQSDE